LARRTERPHRAQPSHRGAPDRQRTGPPAGPLTHVRAGVTARSGSGLDTAARGPCPRPRRTEPGRRARAPFDHASRGWLS
jgi:hypothetical protein